MMCIRLHSLFVFYVLVLCPCSEIWALSIPTTQSLSCLSREQLIVIQTESDEELSLQLHKLKTSGILRKWGSTLMEYRPVSETELFSVTRTTFGTKDYLADITESSKQSSLIGEELP